MNTKLYIDSRIWQNNWVKNFKNIILGHFSEIIKGEACFYCDQVSSLLRNVRVRFAGR
jgi:hypothetical protein